MTDAPDPIILASDLLVAPSSFQHYLDKFDAEDRENAPKPGGVIFVGSSSIERWDTLAKDFEGIDVVNRGIGGSALIDMIRYADRIILKYQPRAIVLYCGENDIALYGLSYTDVCRHFQTFVDLIHRQSPDVQILCISIKPSPERTECLRDVVKANRQIQTGAKARKNVVFVDVVTAMLDERGNVRDDLFVDDGVHLSPEGYRVWTSVIRPHLETALASN